MILKKTLALAIGFGAIFVQSAALPNPKPLRKDTRPDINTWNNAYIDHSEVDMDSVKPPKTPLVKPPNIPIATADPLLIKPTPSPLSGVPEFSVKIYKPGVPFLHFSSVKVKPDDSLVVNDGSEAAPLMAQIGVNQKNLMPGGETTEGVIVDVDDKNSLKIGFISSSGEKSTSPSTLKGMAFKEGKALIQVSPSNVVPSSLDGTLLVHAYDPTNPAGPWSVSNDKLLQLNRQSLAWACPQNKSGVYKIFWDQDKPKGENGCMRVDLYLDDQNN